ncbi:uncharacterized protein LOC144935372 [Lampetra fluviatilis]
MVTFQVVVMVIVVVVMLIAVLYVVIVIIVVVVVVIVVVLFVVVVVVILVLFVIIVVVVVVMLVLVIVVVVVVVVVLVVMVLVVVIVVVGHAVRGAVEYWDQQQRRCHLCDAACRTCSGSGRDSCTSCEGTSLWKGQCVYSCPPDTFLWGARCIACADHTTPPDCLNCRTDACAAYDAAARHRSVVKAAVIVSLALGVAAIAGVLIFARSRRGGGGPCPPCPSLSRDCCPVGYRRLRTAVGGDDANSRVGEAPLKFRANGEGVTLVGAEEGAEEGDGGDSGDEAGTGFKVMYVSGDGKVYRKFYYGSDDEGAVEDL